MTSADTLPMAIDHDRLFALRLVIARLGEMDNAGWWNTRGMLGPNGAFVLRRGFPRTHLFAQARVVFAVAAQRCQAVFQLPDAVTLWRMPAPIEDAFEDRWPTLIDHADHWAPLFARVAALRGQEVLGALRDLDLVDEALVEAARGLRPSLEGNAVKVAAGSLDARALALLAAGFACAAPGQMAVPYLGAV